MRRADPSVTKTHHKVVKCCFYMRWVSAAPVVLLAAAGFVIPGAPDPPEHSSKSATAQLPGRKSAKTNKSTPHIVPVSRSSSRVSRTGAVRGRKKTRVRAAPAPSYQLHPDPDRYQQIQKALADRGYFKGEPNGTWGDDSVDALKRFQADQKLPDDGKINALTLIGLGLGPKRDGGTTAPPPVAGTAAVSAGEAVPSRVSDPPASTSGPPASEPPPDLPSRQAN